MGNKILILDALLKEDNQYSMEELKEILCLDENDLIKELFNNMLKSIKEIDENKTIKEYEYLIKTFDVIYDTKSIVYNYENINKLILQIRNEIKKKKKLLNNDNKKNNELISLIENMQYKIKAVEMFLIDKCYNDNYKYWFIFYLISDIDNYQLIKDILTDSPRFINLRDQNKKHIFNYLIENYLEIIFNYNDLEVENKFIYFENLIDIFTQNDRFCLKEKEKENVINMINNIYNKLEVSKINKKNKKIVKEKLENLKENLSIKKKVFDCESSINILKERYNITSSFDNIIIPNKFNLKNEKRLDLTKELIFTIDGDGSLDLDDALSLKKLNNGNYLLGVHITHVSSYVERGTNLDEEAYIRESNIYLSNDVITMLPPVLCNDVCSLLPNSNKLAISYMIEITKDGQLVEYNFYKSIIKSKYKLTYENVSCILNGDNSNNELKEILNDMIDLSYILKNKNEHKNKYRSLKKSVESIINNKTVDDIKHPSIKHMGEQIVEEFMILSNHLVADYFHKNQLPFLYRNHDKIDVNKLINDMKLIQNKIYKDNDFEYDRFVKIVLNSYPDAKYDKNNKGHYGLGLRTYSHSTSPMRRYADLVIQRIMEDLVFNKDNVDEYLYYWEDNLDIISKHLNNRQYLNKEFASQYEHRLSKVKR
jgi:exoribonuclease R